MGSGGSIGEVCAAYTAGMAAYWAAADLFGACRAWSVPLGARLCGPVSLHFVETPGTGQPGASRAATWAHVQSPRSRALWRAGLCQVCRQEAAAAESKHASVLQSHASELELLREAEAGKAEAFTRAVAWARAESEAAASSSRSDSPGCDSPSPVRAAVARAHLVLKRVDLAAQGVADVAQERLQVDGVPPLLLPQLQL